MDAIRVARVDNVTLLRNQPHSSSASTSASSLSPSPASQSHPSSSSGYLPTGPTATPHLLRSTGTLHLTAHHLIFTLDPVSAAPSIQIDSRRITIEGSDAPGEEAIDDDGPKDEEVPTETVTQSDATAASKPTEFEMEGRGTLKINDQEIWVRNPTFSSSLLASPTKD